MKRKRRRKLNLGPRKRIVKLKYSHRPLAVKGSIKTIGCRFNIGDVDAPVVTPFPALYGVEDFDTGIQELLQTGMRGLVGNRFLKRTKITLLKRHLLSH